MKNPNFLNLNNWMMIALFVIPLLTTSCNNDDDDTDPITITVDDAAELVAFSLANRTYGAVNDLNYIADEILELVDCNESQMTSRSDSDVSSDGEITITYSITEEYSMTCEDVEVVTYSFTADQSITSIRYDTDQKVDGSWTIEGVEEDAAEIIYNGPYNRNGEWTYNLRDNRTDEVIYNSTFLNITYNPDSGRITGGTSTFSLEGTSTVYESYTYEGDVEFQGSDISIITFSSGEQYELNLETGEITEI